MLFNTQAHHLRNARFLIFQKKKVVYMCIFNLASLQLSQKNMISLIIVKSLD